jgi:hypothetical protein
METSDDPELNPVSKPKKESYSYSSLHFILQHPSPADQILAQTVFANVLKRLTAARFRGIPRIPGAATSSRRSFGMCKHSMS